MDMNTKNSEETTIKISSQLRTIFRLFNPFLILGILLQGITWWYYKESWVSGISGILGIVAVVWVSQKRLIAYIPCFLQLGTYLWLAVQQKLWGEVGENIFYLITMIIGLFIWTKTSGNGLVLPRSLKKKSLGIISSITLLGIIILWFILSKTNDTQPLLDSVTTIPAIVAQILMILRYREQWIFWIIIDIFSILMWWNAGNMCMVLQFMWWTTNCLYGYKLWGR